MKTLFLNILTLSLILSFSNCSFQLSIFKETVLKYKEETIFLSPLSLYQALGLTSNGANGTTQEEMISVLEGSSQEEINKNNIKNLELIKASDALAIANCVMTKGTPTELFQEQCRKYDSPIFDLVSEEEINKWSNEKTNGKIPEIIDSLPPLTVMVLLNAVYFKGTWKYKFDASLTKKKIFYNSNSINNGVLVDTMSLIGDLPYKMVPGAQIVQLPYKEGKMSAFIILPFENIDINDFIKKLNDETLNDYISSMSAKRVELQLPKFEIKFDKSMVEVLQNLGMLEAFGRAADLSNLFGGGSLYINDVKHKAYLNVDEKGSEAAATTIVVIVSRAGSSIASVEVNRPFIFLIKDDNLPEGHNLVFMGKIEKLG